MLKLSVPAAATPMTTIGGHAVQITAFIPDNKNDLRAQGNVLSLLADIMEGKRALADLVPMLRGVEFRASYTRKRFTAEEVSAMMQPSAPAPVVPEPSGE